jgi:Protein of unknown function (DUF3617)
MSMRNEMRLLFTAIAALSLSAAATAAQADDFPARKAGLWEVTMQLATAQHRPMTSKLCIDAASDTAMQKAALENAGVTCAKRDIVRAGQTVTVDSICTVGQSTLTTHMAMLFESDTLYHMETQSHFEPPLAAGHADSTMKQDGKWVGPCPADMKPGDIVMFNGMKINVLGALSGAK